MLNEQKIKDNQEILKFQTEKISKILECTYNITHMSRQYK